MREQKGYIKNILIAIIIMGSAIVALGASSPVLSLNLKNGSPSAATISVAGMPEGDYEVLYSPDLKIWKHSKNLTGNSSGQLSFYVSTLGDMSFFQLKSGLNTAAGSASITLDSSSPADSFVKISQTETTRGVLLGIFDVKMKNLDGNLLKIRVNVNSAGSSSINSIFSDIKLKIGGSIYSADSVTATASLSGSSAVATFANIVASLPAGINVQIQIIGDVAKDSDGRNDQIKVNVSIGANGTGGGLDNNPTILDINYENVEVDDNVVTSSDLSLISLPVMVWNETVSKGPFITPQAGGGSVLVGFGFTLTAFDVPLFMSKDTLTAIGVQAGYGATAELLPTPDMVEPSTAGGDGTTYYYIAPGASRTFHYIGKIKVENATTGDPSLRVTAINLGTAPGINSITITNGLEGLRIH